MSNKWPIRPMLLLDQPIAREVYVDAVLNLPEKIYSKAQLDAWAAVALLPGVLDTTLQKGFGLVSCSKTAIEAFAVLYPADRVALLYCRARSHRQGRGKQLLQALEEEAIKQGVRQLRTEASYISQPLFESLGWVTEQKEHLLIAGIAFERFRMGKTL
ncbi:MAG: GNAT family N-acetyltransferase [Cyanobacteria bacterium]|nr:GNAT family N-acetyltransferase [Cyanobacteriota bacterium]MDA1169841.1 GNAT family N-acetyltransferase [Cyanobacteriota bacterium]